MERWIDKWGCGRGLATSRESGRSKDSQSSVESHGRAHLFRTVLLWEGSKEMGGSVEVETQGGLILCFLRNRDASVSCILKGVLFFCGWFDHTPWVESMLLYFLRSLPVLLLRCDWLFKHKVPATCGDKVCLRLRSRTLESFLLMDKRICLISSSEVRVLDVCVCVSGCVCVDLCDGMLRWLYTRLLVWTLAVRLRHIGGVARGEQGAEPPVKGMLGTLRESEWCRNELPIGSGLAESTESLFIASYSAKCDCKHLTHHTNSHVNSPWHTTCLWSILRDFCVVTWCGGRGSKWEAGPVRGSGTCSRDSQSHSSDFTDRDEPEHERKTDWL